ncbi:hypothetical protein [Sandarakinorhabdus sp. DWP1-3-1]|uniref:hypothetical protein n=1 Tax=Sandarakinorhabdus sp. DWP1-3-1 TaxID=2804627 RepID=UPI003CEC5227
MSADNPFAFPEVPGDCNAYEGRSGMTLRDWFAGQALANPTICTGHADERHYQRWFGGRTGIERWEIVAKQAGDYADAMLAERAE